LHDIYVYTQAQHLRTQWKLERQAAAQRSVDPKLQALDDFNGYVAALLAASSAADSDDSTEVNTTSHTNNASSTAADASATELEEPWVLLDEVLRTFSESFFQIIV
jgi:hypothetical protein